MTSTVLWRILRGSGCIGDVNDVNNYFACGGPLNVDEDEVRFDSFLESNNAFSFSCVRTDDIAVILSKIKSKSVVVDGMSVTFLNIIFPLISELILNLLNSILTLHYGKLLASCQFQSVTLLTVLII